jgi:drug/metabolite transporter (DMT)-like permease
VERAGVELGVVVAICWGSADTVATFAARRIGTFATTFISLIVSVVVLVLFGLLAFARLALTPTAFVQSAGIGLLIGLMAAIGYFSLYRGLELGPVAIVSPVVAADGAVGAVLAILLLHEHVSAWELGMLVIIFLGIMCASTNLTEVRGLLRSAGPAGLARGGVRWGLLATAAFGLMLFGIGLASGLWGWFPPIFWTRVFAALAMLVGVTLRRLWSRRTGESRSGHNETSFSPGLLAPGLAAVVGLFEIAGLLVYSFDTQLASTGLAAAISSCFGIIPLVAGITIFRERPVALQLFGVFLVIAGLFLLAIKPA